MSNSIPFKKALLATALATAALSTSVWQAKAAAYVQTNLVSDIPGLAIITEPELMNPWGVSRSATSPFWTSNQQTGTTTLFTVTSGIHVTKVTAVNPPTGNITIPPTAGGPQGPTGQVNNGNTSSFLVGNGGNNGSAHFIFANLNGTISAWDTGPTAFTQATTAGAVYTGLAINTPQTELFAANDAGTGSINVFNSSFTPVSPSGTFTDPSLPTGLVPFNVQDIGGKVYVTYAPAGRTAQTMAAEGTGVVDVFDEDGNFERRLITGSKLAAPWGITLAPSGFGQFGGDLLVGNFSYLHSEINAFDPTSGAFEGTIPIDVGADHSPGGLWDLIFGNGGNGGSADILYFTDGINGETDGLFGALTVPEPSGLAVLAAALAFLGIRRRGWRSAPAA